MVKTIENESSVAHHYITFDLQIDESSFLTVTNTKRYASGRGVGWGWMEKTHRREKEALGRVQHPRSCFLDTRDVARYLPSRIGSTLGVCGLWGAVMA